MKATLPIRKMDGYGAGHYGASRGDRIHHGQDYVAYPGTFIHSEVSGIVTKIGWPYANDIYRYVQIETTVDGQVYDVRYFYLNPLCKVGDHILADDIIGTVQDLTLRYKDTIRNDGTIKKMQCHVHREVKHNGQYFNPEKFLEKLQTA